MRSQKNKPVDRTNSGTYAFIFPAKFNSISNKLYSTKLNISTGKSVTFKNEDAKKAKLTNSAEKLNSSDQTAING